ncbi:MAG: hypothetical protein H0X37_22370 [Herpetosiphonaceae bacterium]|nr:hypothetical protein [Herpetosiphonaceae bacterium]
MNLALMEKIANAVLYEGYMLYPYRPSSVKNQQRWTFGGICPQSYSLAQGGTEAWTMQTECVVVGERPVLEVRLRFLHLIDRQVGVLVHPQEQLVPGAEPDFRVVDVLQVGERRVQAWQEATEREAGVGELPLTELINARRQIPFAFPYSRELEPVRDAAGPVIGVIVREQQPINGILEIEAAQTGDRLWKLTVRIMNLTTLDQAEMQSRDVALLRSFISTHTLFGVQRGEFVSLFDPPTAYSELVASCQNVGSWPVLVGEPEQADMLLASPIILYDYPQIAPESPGDLFDGTEIDEILTLRILTMTEEEKREMGAVDERARVLLSRTEALAREQLMSLHGTVRGMRPLGDGQ